MKYGQKGLREGVSLLQRRLLVSVEVNVQDESYPWILGWMTQHQRSQLARLMNRNSDAKEKSKRQARLLDSLFDRFAPRMRNLTVQTDKVENANGSMQTQFSLHPGVGRHFIRYKHAFVMAERVRDEKSRDLQSGRPWETITLTTLYAHAPVIEQMFSEAYHQASKAKEGKTIIYNSFSTDWRAFGEPRRKRPLDSVILDEGVKEKIVTDVEDFIKSAEWYYGRGIPYRRGYLLHGPPGGGKSSFISALAGHLDYDIAILNLSERGLTDDRLNHLLTKVPQRTLVLLEDVDVAFANRRTHTDADGYRGATVTFSGLLNALDGVASAEERILFLTTNYAERLDEALVRPGRVDMTVRIGEVSRYQAMELWNRFYGDEEESATYQHRFMARLADLGLVPDVDGRSRGRRRYTSAAALQSLFLYNKGDMQGAISMADHLAPRSEERPEEMEGSDALPAQAAQQPIG